MIAVADPTADRVEEPRSELADCRAQIEEIDLKLIALLAERDSLGKRTRVLKQDAGLPNLEPQREAQFIRRAVAAARDRALPIEPVRQIFWHIVGLSRRAQEETT